MLRLELSKTALGLLESSPPKGRQVAGTLEQFAQLALAVLLEDVSILVEVPPRPSTWAAGDSRTRAGRGACFVGPASLLSNSSAPSTRAGLFGQGS